MWSRVSRLAPVIRTLAPPPAAGAARSAAPGADGLARYLGALLVWAVVSGAGTAGGQTVRLGLEELVGEADTIVRVRVIGQAAVSERAETGRAIVTRVTFRVDRTLKGPARRELVLEFLGGTIGDETLAVSGVPTFSLGDRAVLFARAGERLVSPIVGVMQGRFPIRTSPDGTREMVTLYDGRAFSAIDQVGVPVTRSATPIPTMTLAGFEAMVEALVEASP